MCDGASLEKIIEAEEQLRIGHHIPLRRWRGEKPEKVKIEKTTKRVKSGDKVQDVASFNLATEEGTVIKRGWKFDWAPRKLLVKEGFLWGSTPDGCMGVYQFHENNKPVSTVASSPIKLGEKSLQGYGLLEGEMIRSRNGKSRHYISFSSMTPKYVETVLETLDLLGANRPFFRAQPIVNIREGKPDADAVAHYWKDKTPLQDKHLVSVYHDERYRTDATYGSINLKYYDTVLRKVLEWVLQHIKDKSCPKVVTPFLQGLMAAEGSVNVSPTNRLNHIAIGVKDSALRKQYERLLSSIGIKSGGVIGPVSNEEAQERGWNRGTGGYFMIQGISNFKRVFDTRLMQLSPRKEIEFLLGLDKHDKTPESLEERITSRLQPLRKHHPEMVDSVREKHQRMTDRDKEILSLVQDLGKCSNKNLAKELGISRSSASRRMRSLFEKGKVVRKVCEGEVIWSPCQDS